MRVNGFRVSVGTSLDCEELREKRELSIFVRKALYEYEKAGRPDIPKDNSKLSEIFFVKLNEKVNGYLLRNALRFKMYFSEKNEDDVDVEKHQ